MGSIAQSFIAALQFGIAFSIAVMQSLLLVFCFLLGLVIILVMFPVFFIKYTLLK
jgi:hypothetical protein